MVVFRQGSAKAPAIAGHRQPGPLTGRPHLCIASVYLGGAISTPNSGGLMATAFSLTHPEMAGLIAPSLGHSRTEHGRDKCPPL